MVSSRHYEGLVVIRQEFESEDANLRLAFAGLVRSGLKPKQISHAHMQGGQ